MSHNATKKKIENQIGNESIKKTEIFNEFKKNFKWAFFQNLLKILAKINTN